MVRVSEGETGTETACCSDEEAASPSASPCGLLAGPSSSCSGATVSSSADLNLLTPRRLFGVAVAVQHPVEELATAPGLRRRRVRHGRAGEELGMKRERLGL